MDVALLVWLYVEAEDLCRFLQDRCAELCMQYGQQRDPMVLEQATRFAIVHVRASTRAERRWRLLVTALCNEERSSGTSPEA